MKTNNQTIELDYIVNECWGHAVKRRCKKIGAAFLEIACQIRENLGTGIFADGK
jgi:hypothetical protein